MAADVVRLAGDRALYPSRWELIAELALEHASVRAALRADNTELAAAHTDPLPLSTRQIIAQLNSLHGLIGADHAHR